MKCMYTVIKTEVCIKYVISCNEEYISNVYDIYGWQNCYKWWVYLKTRCTYGWQAWIMLHHKYLQGIISLLDEGVWQ